MGTVPRGEWGKLRYLELLQQIKLRKEMMKQLVGSLYQSILRDEIADLQELCNRLEKTP